MLCLRLVGSAQAQLPFWSVSGAQVGTALGTGLSTSGSSRFLGGPSLGRLPGGCVKPFEYQGLAEGRDSGELANRCGRVCCTCWKKGRRLNSKCYLTMGPSR